MMMRALIFLCFFGSSLAAAILDCTGCYAGLAGTNDTDTNATASWTRVPEQQPTVKWDGTWISIKSSLGFPPKPDDQNDLEEAKATDNKLASSAKDRSKARRRRVARAPSNWNPLGTELGFKDDGNQENGKMKDHQAGLNATAVAPLDGSNSTSNSSTVAEQTNPPSGNENGKMKDHQAGVRSTASPEPNPPKMKNPPPSFWHPLKSSPGFPPEESEKQTKKK